MQTTRLRIRRFESGDLQALVSLMSDPETMKYTGFKTPQSLEKIKTLHLKWREEGRQACGVWCVETKDSKEFVGWVMLRQTQDADPELGYMIHKPSWGRGYATEVALGMLGYARQNQSISKVIARCSSNNPASTRVLTKIGMTKVPDQPNERDSWLYEINF
ncbi:MAG: GNAT family N-acetyltransferase [Bdellovibrionota bacterium]